MGACECPWARLDCPLTPTRVTPGPDSGDTWPRLAQEREPGRLERDPAAGLADAPAAAVAEGHHPTRGRRATPSRRPVQRVLEIQWVGQGRQGAVPDDDRLLETHRPGEGDDRPGERRDGDPLDLDELLRVERADVPMEAPVDATAAGAVPTHAHASEWDRPGPGARAGPRPRCGSRPTPRRVPALSTARGAHVVRPGPSTGGRRPTGTRPADRGEDAGPAQPLDLAVGEPGGEQLRPQPRIGGLHARACPAPTQRWYPSARDLWTTRATLPLSAATRAVERARGDEKRAWAGWG